MLGERGPGDKGLPVYYYNVTHLRLPAIELLNRYYRSLLCAVCRVKKNRILSLLYIRDM